MFYFNDKPSSFTSNEALEQRGKVLEFRKGFPEQGMYWPYKGKAEFVKHANDHLRKYIQQQISIRASAKRGNTRGPGAERNTHREGRFPLVLGKDGAAQFPNDMLRQLGLAEGDSLDFTISNHHIISVSPLAAPFDPKTIELLSKRQSSAAENLNSSEDRQTLKRRGRHD